MPYSMGETYIWTDGEGRVHIWGCADDKLDRSVWKTMHEKERVLAGVVLSPAIWKSVKDAVLKEVLEDTAKRILVGEYSKGKEEEEEKTNDGQISA